MKSVILLCLLGIAAARSPYQFSDGYLEVLREEPTQEFTCDERPYGYYADTANDCKVFHVCFPLENHEGEVTDTLQYSFFCGNQTVFNQESLTCTYPEDAVPCSDAESLYRDSNAGFGVIPEDKVEKK